MKTNEKKPSKKVTRTHKQNAPVELDGPKMTTRPIVLAPSGVDPDDVYRAAFERTKAARDALLPEDLVRTNVDIVNASNTAQTAFPGMAIYRSIIEASIKDFDFAQFDAIPDYALAAAQAQADYKNLPFAGDLPALYAEVQSLRDGLRADLAGLVNRKILDETSLDDLSGTVGYNNVGLDVLRLASLAEAHSSAIANKTALTPSEITRAKNTVNRMMLAARAREAAGTIEKEAADTRQRALTLLVRAYDAARDAIGYVRRKESDIATIAPTLYITRGKKKDDTVTPVPAPVTITPSAPATPVASPAPAVPVPLAPVATPAVPAISSPADVTTNVIPLLKKSA